MPSSLSMFFVRNFLFMFKVKAMLFFLKKREEILFERQDKSHSNIRICTISVKSYCICYIKKSLANMTLKTKTLDKTCNVLKTIFSNLNVLADT